MVKSPLGHRAGAVRTVAVVPCSIEPLYQNLPQPYKTAASTGPSGLVKSHFSTSFSGRSVDLPDCVSRSHEAPRPTAAGRHLLRSLLPFQEASWPCSDARIPGPYVCFRPGCGHPHLDLGGLRASSAREQLTFAPSAFADDRHRAGVAVTFSLTHLGRVHPPVASVEPSRLPRRRSLECAAVASFRP